MHGLALNIYQLFQHKKNLNEGSLPKLINMEPGGPNFTRKEMKPTHQSAVDSIISAFRLALALNKINLTHQGTRTNCTSENWLDATATLFIHQNQYELGPDRFNENVFIYTRLLSYLAMSPEQLQQQKQKQAAKSSNWSLFHRKKDFIIDGVDELRQLGQLIWSDQPPQEQNQKIIEFIRTKIHFPLIHETLTTQDIFQFKSGQVSTIIPNTFFTDKHGHLKRKGERCALIP